MGLAPEAIPIFKQGLRANPDTIFGYIDGVFNGFTEERGLELYLDWERIFIENDDQTLLEKFYRKYGAAAS